MEGRELELLGLLRVMRRHAGVIFSSLVIALGLGVLALFLMAPIYSASAVIFVDPAPKNVLASETVLGNDDDARVDSEIELMGTDAVLIRVIDELGLVKDPEFGVKAGIISQLLTLAGMPAPTLPTGSEAVNEVIANVRESLSFQRRGGTYVVGVTAKAPSPEGAARLANSVAGAYIAQQLDAKVGAVLASRNAIEGRMADAAAAVESSETAIDDFIDRQIGLLGASGTTASFLDLRDRVAKLEATTTTGDDAVRQASAALAGEDWDTVLSSLKSQALETLESQRTALAHAMAVQPRLLILDEPLSGLDPIGRRDVVDILAEYRQKGGTIFLTSHVLHDVERLADRFGLIHKGELRAVRAPGELAGADDRVLVRSQGAAACSGMVAEPGGRWVVEVPRPQLWHTLMAIQAAGHTLIEIRPTLSLESVFLHVVREA